MPVTVRSVLSCLEEVHVGSIDPRYIPYRYSIHFKSWESISWTCPRPRRGTSMLWSSKTLQYVANGLLHPGPKSYPNREVVGRGSHSILWGAGIAAFDRATNLFSHLMLDLCKLLGIQKLNTTSYHPQCDGMVERFNRTLKTMLRNHASRFGDQWDQHLSGVLWAYRNTPHESTAEKPSFLLFGRDCRSPSEAALLLPYPIHTNRCVRLSRTTGVVTIHSTRGSMPKYPSSTETIRMPV